jgi:isoleucyl-tRNA synthetase
MKIMQEMLTVIMAAREKVKIGLKWPLASAEIMSKQGIRKEIAELLERQANIKKISFRSGDVIDVSLNTEMTPELEAEGYARELARKIQSSRKKINLIKENEIDLVVQADSELLKMLKTQEKALKERVNAVKISFLETEKKAKGYKNVFEEGIKDKKLKISFNVL